MVLKLQVFMGVVFLCLDIFGRLVYLNSSRVMNGLIIRSTALCFIITFVNVQSPLSQQSNAALESFFGGNEKQAILTLDLVAHRPLASSQSVYTGADGVTNRMDFR